MNATEKILTELRSLLEEGAFAPGSRFPSEADLADNYGVSKLTMNKIVSVLADNGYLTRGNRGAGTRVTEQLFRPHGIIAFLGRFSPYHLRLCKGAQEECLRRGYFLAVFAPETDRFQACLNMLHKRNVCGIITCGYGLLHPPEGVEVFCLDYTLKHENSIPHLHFLNSANYEGGRRMMEAILRRGHRDFVIYSSERFYLESKAPIAPRVRGFHAMMKEAGIRDYSARTFYGIPNSLSDAKQSLREILACYPGVTLICTDSDNSADLLHRAGQELGVEIPGKIALTGFGDVTHLPIATVNQSPERQGELAARHLIDRNEDPSLEVPREELVETSLVNEECIPILFN